MRGLYCITFTEYMLAGEILLDYTNFTPNDYKKNDKAISAFYAAKFYYHHF